MYILYIAAAFSLLSVMAAVPLPCEELIKPLVLEDLSQISGKWIVIAVTVDHPKYVALLKTVNSAWVEVVPTSHNDTAIFNKATMINEVCAYSPVNLTISDNVIHFTLEANMTGNATATLLQTCTDCLVMNGITLLNGEKIKTLHLLGRPGNLSNYDLEAFKKQTECIGLPQPRVIHDEHHGLCPDNEKDVRSNPKPKN